MVQQQCHVGDGRQGQLPPAPCFSQLPQELWGYYIGWWEADKLELQNLDPNLDPVLPQCIGGVQISGSSVA